jgi:hypothetical protein
MRKSHERTNSLEIASMNTDPERGPSPGFLKQLAGYGLTTAEIL